MRRHQLLPAIAAAAAGLTLTGPAGAFAQPAKAAAGARPPSALERLEKSWVEPDTSTPSGTMYRTFRSRTIGADVSYLVYLPPGYEEAGEQRFPVLYWLHGTGGTQTRGAEVVKRADAAIRVDRVPPMLVVLVNGLRGATMYCDSRDGKWLLETVIVRDLVPHIDQTYRTLARREARAVEGFSMGGFGAAHLGFKFPELFGVVSILAPALLGPDLNIRWEEHFSHVFNNDLVAFEAENPFRLAARNADRLRGRSLIRLVPHDEPGKWLIARCDQLHAVLTENGIAHEYDPRRDVNKHNYVLLYDALGEKALGFYATAFGNLAPAAKARTSSISRGAPATSRPGEPAWETLPDGSVGRSFTYRTADGLGLAAYVRRPVGAGPFPAIVFLPGGGGQKEAALRMGRSVGHPFSDFVAEGWAVFALSYRPPDPPTPNMDPREWDDVARAIGAVREFPFVDGDRVALVGHSHGARVVTMMASRVDVRCGVSMAPVTLNLVEMAKRRGKGEAFNTAAQRMMDNMEQIHRAKILEQPGLFLRFSPFPEVNRVRFPLLLMYAEDDNGGPIGIVQEYVAELKRAGREVEAYYPPQGGHGVFFGQPRAGPETAETARRAVAFIRKLFAGPSQAAAALPAGTRSPPNRNASARVDPPPPVCYDISKPFPGEIPQYRVSRESKPVEPFEILDGLYYVGNTQVGAHLLATTNGLVLFDTTMPHQVPWLIESIRKLGFDPRDVKLVVGNHAHLDHIGGHWYFKHHYGAETWLHEAEAAATESGAWRSGQPVVLDGTLATISVAYPPFKTDRKLRDGESIEWGGRRIIFHVAAGHTPGTLFTQIPLRDKSGKTVMAGMLGGIGAGRPEFARTVAKLRTMDVQLVLGAHPNQNQTLEKFRWLKAGAATNPFIDSAEWTRFLDRLDQAAAGRRPPSTPRPKR